MTNDIKCLSFFQAGRNTTIQGGEKILKRIRWWLAPEWIPTFEIDIDGWKKADGAWTKEKNADEMIITVKRKKDFSIVF